MESRFIRRRRFMVYPFDFSHAEPDSESINVYCHPELVSGSLILQILHKTNMFYLRC